VRFAENKRGVIGIRSGQLHIKTVTINVPLEKHGTKTDRCPEQTTNLRYPSDFCPRLPVHAVIHGKMNVHRTNKHWGREWQVFKADRIKSSLGM